MKYSKLINKVVINVDTGEILGHIADVDIDVRTYQVNEIQVLEKGGILERLLPWLFKSNQIKIYIGCIDSIGADAILVKLNK